jgi:hypothetical protein
MAVTAHDAPGHTQQVSVFELKPSRHITVIDEYCMTTSQTLLF